MKNIIRTFRAFGIGQVFMAGIAIVILILTLSGCVTIPTVTPPTATATEQSFTTPLPYCTVNADKVYLRAGAGKNFEALTVTHKGDALTVLNNGEWLKVSTGQQTGYIYSQFCTTGD